MSVLPFHVMAKPVGPACNLACSYCFYVDNATARGTQGPPRMDDTTLERAIREQVEAQPPGAEVHFAWQGGEPTLAGLDFFRRVVRLQAAHARGRVVRNALQTNGTLLTPEWARFLKDHDFLVGISVDGPPALHDAMRVDRKGGGSAAEVVAGMRLLRRFGVAFNTLTVVGRHNVKHPLEVYGFLVGEGSRHVQFIPHVERRVARRNGSCGARDYAMPPDPSGPVVGEASPETVPAAAFGGFLVAVFEQWRRRDVGKVYVQLFESAVAAWLGYPPSLCVFSATCGRGLAMERDGSVYACDHYVHEHYRRGRLGERPLEAMVEDPAQVAFGEAKRSSLTAACRDCPWLFACGGDCPKHRFARAPDGAPGQSWLCPSYQRFFAHADPILREFATAIRHRDRGRVRHPPSPFADSPCGESVLGRS